MLPLPAIQDRSYPFDTTGADEYDGFRVASKADRQRPDPVAGLHLCPGPFPIQPTFTLANTRGLNQFNPNGEWSVARDDRTHILNISQVYEFPFGPGKKFLNHRGTFMKNLVGGWEISGNYYYASGTPVQIIEIGRPMGFTNAPNRANILPGLF